MTLSTAAVGCLGDPGGPLYVDSRFSEEERLAVEAAAEMWRAHGAPIDLIFGAHTTGRDPSRRELVRARGRREAASLMEIFKDSDRPDGAERDGLLVIDMEYLAEVGDSLPAVVAHEMGHMLGLQHVGTDRTALMSAYRNSGSPVAPTAVDLAELCRVTGLGCSARREAQVSP